MKTLAGYQYLLKGGALKYGGCGPAKFYDPSHILPTHETITPLLLRPMKLQHPHFYGRC